MQFEKAKTIKRGTVYKILQKTVPLKFFCVKLLGAIPDIISICIYTREGYFDTNSLFFASRSMK